MTNFTESDHPRAKGKFTDKAQSPAETELVPEVTLEQVFAALPENGEPIMAGDLAAVLDTSDRKQLFALLTELRSNGTAGVIYGRGWRRVKHLTPNSLTTEQVLEALPEDGDPIMFGELVARVGLEVADQARVRELLLELNTAGTAGVIYGRGWRRLPLQTAV